MYNKQKFIKSVFDVNDLPKNNLPEIVLCGRSNVGKSSLINSFFNRKDLAKVSSTPGKTRSINYYEIDDKFYVVDLPGFGYAKISKKEREYWRKLIGEYFANSKNIKLVIHLIDSRHKPTELDINVNEMLNHYLLSYIFLLSKADKLKQSELKRSVDQVKLVFPEARLDENLIFYSSVKGTGKKDLQKIFSLTTG